MTETSGICFEDIFIAIKEGGVLDTKKHPDNRNYPNEFVYIVEIRRYVYMVPFVVETEYIFLKTIVPGRKLTQKPVIPAVNCRETQSGSGIHSPLWRDRHGR